jgi:hypothetical protein
MCVMHDLCVAANFHYFVLLLVGWTWIHVSYCVAFLLHLCIFFFYLFLCALLVCVVCYVVLFCYLIVVIVCHAFHRVLYSEAAQLFRGPPSSARAFCSVLFVAATP